jgi:PAS domain S-box-containing protein
LDRAQTMTDRPASEVARLRRRVTELEAARSELQRAETALRQQCQQLALLHRILDRAVTEEEPAVILASACRLLAEELQVTEATAYLRTGGIGRTAVAARYPEIARAGARDILQASIDLPTYPDWMALQSPLAVTAGHDTADLRSVQERMLERGVLSLLVLPVQTKEICGCLELCDVSVRGFLPEEIALCEQACLLVARALARSAMARKHRQLSTAIEQASESMIVADVQGAILYVNPAFERMSGYGLGEATGQTPRILKSGEHDGAFYRHLWSTITAGDVWHGHLVNRRKDSSCYTVDATITPVRDGNGNTVNYVSLQRDITRELQLEEQYRQAQKMEVLGQLTAGIAHDFNNVLTAVNGYAELLQAQLKPVDPARDMVDKLLRAGRRGADLVHQLLLFSRKQANTPQTVSLNHVVSDLETMLRRIIGEQIQLVTQLTPDVWSVRADPTHIEQIIVNLVVNARDAMPNGGGLSIETANVVLDENYVGGHLEARPGEHILLAISDTGCGMTPEVKAHLFEPFFTTKGRGKGTGLGLATVYGIVKQHGGNIWVYSEEGSGTTIKIYLPRVAQAGRPALRAERGQIARGGQETILLVEDDAGVRDLTGMMLQEHGYTVLSAGDGRDALRLARDHATPINLLLSDVVLPDTSAAALTERLKQIHPSLKTLYMSGYAYEVAARHGVTVGRMAFLEKPFNSQELARQVREALDEPAGFASARGGNDGPAADWASRARRDRGQHRRPSER